MARYPVEVAELVAEADRALARGEGTRGSTLLHDAIDRLVRRGNTDDAIDLAVNRRDYAYGAEIAERTRNWERAAKLWFRAGEFANAGRARLQNGEPVLAVELFERSRDFVAIAEIFERLGDFMRASIYRERSGHKKEAADLLVRTLSGEAARGAKSSEICRRAGTLYAEIGHLELAVRVLNWGGEAVFAGQLLARAGKHAEAIALLERSGDLLSAAEIARAAGDEKRANLLLARRAENDGRLSDAASHFEQAEEFGRAARLYEFSDDFESAARCHERAGQLQIAAHAYERLGRIDDARRCLGLAGEFHRLAELSERAGHREDSIRAYAAAEDYFRAATAALAVARAGDAAKYVDAIRFLEAIAKENGDHFRGRVLLAEIWAERGDTRRALSILEALLAGVVPKPEHVSVYYEYGCLLEREGFLANARKIFRVAAALDPSYRDIELRVTASAHVAGAAVDTEDSAETLPGGPSRSAATSPVPRLPSALASSSLDAPVPQASVVDPGTAVAFGGGTRDIANRFTDAEIAELMEQELGKVSEPEPAPEALEATAKFDVLAAIAKPETRPDALAGVVLRGRFRIEKKVGRGAQAYVYLARDQVLDRPVAIKVLNEALDDDEEALERFLREARMGARVHHPGCIAIFDFGQEQDLTFIAMEYFEGRTLREVLERKKLRPSLALRIAHDVACALGAVHAAGIVHRDVKPGNILVDRKGRIRLADFGVAQRMDDGSSAGMMVGTMKYMSPEQARGKDVDARSDIFSLGAVLFEILVGKAPFRGSLDALIQRIDRPAPKLPGFIDVPAIVRTIVDKSLERDPARRYASVVPLVQDLRDAMRDMGSGTPKPAAPPANDAIGVEAQTALEASQDVPISIAIDD